MPNDRRNRSDLYQWKYFEFSGFDPIAWEFFSNNQSLSSYLNPWEYCEELLTTQEEMMYHFWRCVPDLLTKRQNQIVQLLRQGMTQQEISKELDINQSTINKNITGAKNWKESKTKKYGGIIKKLQRFVNKDKLMQHLIQRMHKLQEEKF